MEQGKPQGSLMNEHTETGNQSNNRELKNTIRKTVILMT
jgi:hypothetical protein